MKHTIIDASQFELEEKVVSIKRVIARELARKYSTMTHDELDVMEDILENIKDEVFLIIGERRLTPHS